MKDSSPILLLVLLSALGQSSVAQNYQQRDGLRPELSITSPKNRSPHNYFPAISGTVVDKPWVIGSNISVPPSGVAFVKVGLVADGTVWDGNSWIRPQTFEEGFPLSATVTGEQWSLNSRLPTEPKKSAGNPKVNITSYTIQVLAADNAGNKIWGASDFWVLPVEIFIFDANKKFTDVDLSYERRNISEEDLKRFISFISFPSLTQNQNPADTFERRMAASREVYVKWQSRWRFRAVADGATKLLVIGKGYSPGTLTFESSPEINFTEADKCNKTLSHQIDPMAVAQLLSQLAALQNVPLFDREKLVNLITRRNEYTLCSTGAVTGDKFTHIDVDHPAIDVYSYQKAEHEHYWFALYTVPPDITSNPPNSMLGHAISLTAKYKPMPERGSYSTQSSQSFNAKKTLLFLKRPPVLLVHGLNDDSDSWDLQNNTILQDAGFDVRLLNYRRTNGASFQTNRIVLLGYNSEGILGGGIRSAGIQDVLNEYRQAGTAISKVDVVGHSMGGNLARVFYQQPEYRSDDNFHKGYIRRLITIGTPHLGSNVANILINDVGRNGVNGCGKAALLFAGGEAASVDLSIGSRALMQIGRTEVLSHAITSVETSLKLRGEYKWVKYLPTLFCLGDLRDLLPFGGYLPPIKVNYLPVQGLKVDSQANFIRSCCADVRCDWVVSEISQRGGLASSAYVTPFEGINHGEEIGSIPIRKRVAELLLGGDENFAPDGFPAVASVSPQPPTSFEMSPAARLSANRSAVKPVPAPKKSDVSKPENPAPVKPPISEQQAIANQEKVKLALQSVQITTPDNWQRIQSGNKIALFPADGFQNGRITKGLIYGTLPKTDKPLTISQLENELLSMNPNLKAVTSEGQGTLAGMEAKGRSYKGFSTVINATEEARIYLIKLQGGVSLFILVVAPEAEVASLDALNQLVGSLKINSK